MADTGLDRGLGTWREWLVSEESERFELGRRKNSLLGQLPVGLGGGKDTTVLLLLYEHTYLCKGLKKGKRSGIFFSVDCRSI